MVTKIHGKSQILDRSIPAIKIKASSITDEEVNSLSIEKITNLRNELDSKLSLFGGVMNGIIDMNGFTITGVPIPNNPSDVASKLYVDSKLSGLEWQKPVIAIISQNDLPLNPNIGDRYLIKDGNDINKIAEYTNNGWIFIEPNANWAIFEKQYDQGWVYNSEEASTFKWIQFTGTGQINAGIGLEKIGNTLNVKLGAGITEFPEDEIGIDLALNSGLEFTSNDSDGKLRIKVDGVTTYIDNNGYLKAGDNLGNHMASQNLDMRGYSVIRVGSIGLNGYELNVKRINDIVLFKLDSNSQLIAESGIISFNSLGLGNNYPGVKLFITRESGFPNIFSGYTFIAATSTVFASGNGLNYFLKCEVDSGINYWISSWPIQINTPLRINSDFTILTNNLFGNNQNLNVINFSSIILNNPLVYKDGFEGEGKVLTSDANGKANWKSLLPKEVIERERFILNGNQNTIILSGVPVEGRVMLVYLNGLLLGEGVNEDYVYNPNTKTITFNFIPQIGSKVDVVYNKIVNN